MLSRTRTFKSYIGRYKKWEQSGKRNFLQGRKNKSKAYKGARHAASSRVEVAGLLSCMRVMLAMQVGDGELCLFIPC